MTIPYDVFTGAFLAKITEYDLLALEEDERQEAVDGFMKRTIGNSTFRKVISYNFANGSDDEAREYTVDVDDDSVVDEIIDIVSDGMLIQWLKPYVYKQELLENTLNTRDYTLYSPAELLMRVGNAYTKAQKDYTQALREWSYNHGNLTELHI